MGSQDLQTARYDQLIRRVGGLYGGGSKVVEALPELFPVLELENTTPELMALTGWRTAWQSTERPASAMNNSASNLLNPANSGIIAVVTQLVLRTNVPGTVVQMETNVSAIGGAAVSGLFRDTRFGAVRSTACQVASVDNQAVGGGLRIALQAEDTYIRDDNGIAVLTPLTSLRIGTQSDNTILTVNYWWRERPALESELNFP